MNKKYLPFVIAGVIILAVIGIIMWGVGVRNRLATASEGVDAAWSQVENQYQRRLDLIPNLVETVKGYAAHESSTYENVTRARAGLSDAYNEAAAATAQGQPATEQALDQYADAQSRLKSALSIYVNAVREAYPDLKADTQFTDLQTQLEGTENRIATERQRYIETVRDYNVSVRLFPASMIASMCGFSVKPQFKADAAASQAPKVSF